MIFVFVLLLATSTLASVIPDSLEVKGDPCAFKKCALTEQCVHHEDETQNELIGVCVARKSVVNVEHSIQKRSTHNGYCGDNECRFGECEVLNGTVYACHCFKGVTGSKCNILDKTQLPCASNPCYGSSVCINLPDKYACVCHGDLAGPQCRHHKKPCRCRNGGSCVEDVTDLFRCSCPLGFGGSLCQFEVKANYSCQLPGLGCLNEGVCTISNKCKCPSNFTGLRCETYIATSTDEPTSRVSSTTIEPKLINSRNLCILGVCQNGGTCVQVDFTSAMCICSNGFSGPFCTITTTTKPSVTSSNVTKPKQPYRLAARLIGHNRSSNSTESSSTTLQISSTLTTTSTTVKKEESFCANNSTKCQNGGKCEKDACVCASNFGGPSCETPISCDPSPCKNAQPCLIMHGVARCFCAQEFVEPFCDSKLQQD